MIFLLAGLTLANPDTSVAEAVRALSAGRAEQAREMIRTAIATGAAGPTVDRLLADLAYTEKRWVEASLRYDQLLASSPDDGQLLERAGIARLQQGRVEEAVAILDRALRQPRPGWQAWNARAVAADRRRDWQTSDRAYAAGLKVAPQSASLLNNLGWSLMLRGRWDEAEKLLAQAHALAPGEGRIADNFDLARSAAAAGLPVRERGESDADYAARLNDAGVVAIGQSKGRKAVAAFARALEVSDSWYVRAANNLSIAEASRGN
jgi:Flp pilus assembly protein TadD